ncbi:hypothetical protein PH210_27050 [Paenibacillus sp. BSR1-1]|uniref:hypothetical protein n=1 Tax=Paenibacillus sp. BSR1-1 TaxID=3020845 RepID=UPI0025B1B2B6|nr:hypothetical protein [Paenibacillus sp. BSR1-1]MDN3019827.1 hypothetical protein [Paenibacillus sp. BSR1-1]
MIEALNNFLTKVKEQRHILPLIENADLRVNLNTNQQSIQLVIKNGTIITLQNQPSKYEISGDINAMTQLLEGKQRLRTLKLSISAPLRTILLLESLFYLTKAREEFAKII